MAGGYRVGIDELGNLINLLDHAAQNMANATAALRTASADGLGSRAVDGAAREVFRSPDEPTRPVSAVLCRTRMPSSHESTDIAIDGLREVHQSQGKKVTTLALPAGSAARTFGISLLNKR